MTEYRKPARPGLVDDGGKLLRGQRVVDLDEVEMGFGRVGNCATGSSTVAAVDMPPTPAGPFT